MRVAPCIIPSLLSKQYSESHWRTAREIGDRIAHFLLARVLAVRGTLFWLMLRYANRIAQTGPLGAEPSIHVPVCLVTLAALRVFFQSRADTSLEIAGSPPRG